MDFVGENQPIPITFYFVSFFNYAVPKRRRHNDRKNFNGRRDVGPLTGLSPSVADTKEVVDLETGGTTTGLFIEAPDKPKAVLAIFPGGAGIVEVNNFGTVGFGANNFAVRTRDRIPQAGLRHGTRRRSAGIQEKRR